MHLITKVSKGLTDVPHSETLAFHFSEIKPSSIISILYISSKFGLLKWINRFARKLVCAINCSAEYLFLQRQMSFIFLKPPGMLKPCIQIRWWPFRNYFSLQVKPVPWPVCHRCCICNEKHRASQNKTKTSCLCSSTGLRIGLLLFVFGPLMVSVYTNAECRETGKCICICFMSVCLSAYTETKGQSHSMSTWPQLICWCYLCAGFWVNMKDW